MKFITLVIICSIVLGIFTSQHHNVDGYLRSQYLEDICIKIDAYFSPRVASNGMNDACHQRLQVQTNRFIQFLICKLYMGCGLVHVNFSYMHLLL